MIQYEMLRMLTRLNRKKADSSDSDDESSDGGGHFKAILKLRRRVKREPIKIVASYRKRSLDKLGITSMPNGTLTSPFCHRMTSHRLRGDFGKMTGLWRCHHALSEILELVGQQKVEEGAATAVQALKSCHQAALDGGSWILASTLLPWEDPLGRDSFGGDEAEMLAAAQYTRSLRDLTAQVSKLNNRAKEGEEGGDESQLSRAEKKRQAEARAKAKAAAAAAAVGKGGRT